jgi:hypothetical protein
LRRSSPRSDALRTTILLYKALPRWWWGVPLLAWLATLGAATLLDPTTWQGQWLDTSFFLTVLAFTLIGPFSAVSGHLLGRVIVGPSSTSLTRRSVRGPLRLVIVHFGLGLVPAYLIVTIVTAILVFGRTWSVNGEGSPSWVLVALALSSPIAFGATGLVLGIGLPYRLIVGLLPLAAYTLTILSAQTASTWESSLLPVADIRADPYLMVDATVGGRMLAWSIVVVLGSLAIGATVLWHRNSRPANVARTWLITGAAPIALLVGAALLVNHHGLYELAVEKPPPNPVCADVGRSRACVWPGQEFLVPRYREALTGASALAGDLDSFPATFQQGGLTLEGAWTLTGASTNPTVDELRDDMVRGAAGPYFEVSCSENARASSAASYGAVALDVLFRRSRGLDHVVAGDGTVVRQLFQGDRATQDEWLNYALSNSNVCKPAAFPR